MLLHGKPCLISKFKSFILNIQGVHIFIFELKTVSASLRKVFSVYSLCICSHFSVYLDFLADFGLMYNAEIFLVFSVHAV